MHFRQEMKDEKRFYADPIQPTTVPTVPTELLFLDVNLESRLSSRIEYIDHWPLNLHVGRYFPRSSFPRDVQCSSGHFAPIITNIKFGVWLLAWAWALRLAWTLSIFKLLQPLLPLH